MNATSQRQAQINDRMDKAMQIIRMMKAAENSQPLQPDLRIAALSKLEELLTIQ